MIDQLLVAVVRVGQRELVRHRRTHLDRPSLAGTPPFANKLLCRGCKRIRYRAPYVGAAIPIEIDRIFEVFGRQKLGKSHGAAP